VDCTDPEWLTKYVRSACQPQLSFEKVTGGVTKRVAAAAFLEVLQLKTWGRIDVAQSAPFADIALAPPHSGAL
jgi:chromatin segregation and condensation protein Rec8/ScpA/Scc1 (kleisin family)